MVRISFLPVLNGQHPYRYFFPFSIAGALVGLGLFPFGYSGNIIFWHREMMITLFLLPAAAGFLYTATPRFLAAVPTRATEIRVVMVLLSGLFLTAVASWAQLFLIHKLFLLGAIAVHFTSRWWKKRKHNVFWPPFILTGLLTGFTGNVLQLLGDAASVALGNLLYYDAMFWILLFGIGVKMFPMLTSAAPPAYKSGKSLLSREVYENRWLWFSVAILGLVSFLFQALISAAVGAGLRALLIGFLAYEGWAIFEKPQRKGITTRSVNVFLFTILIAHWIFPFFPAYQVHFYHVVFVGGFLSLTMAIETRVILSHEQLDLTTEQRSPWLLTAYILLYLAMLTRVSAVFMPDSYQNHLKYASLSAIAGLLILLIVAFRAWKEKKGLTR